MQAVIATWIYLDSAEESSAYPQVGARSHLPAFQMVYWQCVAVFYALSVRHNPGARHLLFTNQTPDQLPVQDGFDWPAHLAKLNVEVVTLPLTWQTPPGYFGRWRNQFYIFDILQFFEKQVYDDNTPLLVFDSDCLINRPLEPLFEAVLQQGLMTLRIPYQAEDNINGITLSDMRQLYMELSGVDLHVDPTYFGGEAFAATPPIVRQINALAPAVWADMMQRHRTDRPKFNEEAHFLSYCYHQIGHFGDMSPFLKRIWTAFHYSNVVASDVNLPIWHLPSEKTGGIALLFKWLSQDKSLPADPVKLGGLVGVPKRTTYLNWKHFLKYTAFYRWFIKLKLQTSRYAF